MTSTVLLVNYCATERGWFVVFFLFNEMLLFLIVDKIDVIVLLIRLVIHLML